MPLNIKDAVNKIGKNKSSVPEGTHLERNHPRDSGTIIPGTRHPRGDLSS
jgi:hypothetical protein